MARMSQLLEEALLGTEPPHPQAFQWLDTPYLQHDNGLPLMKVDPLLAGLRSDRRYEALLKKMNVTE